MRWWWSGKGETWCSKGPKFDSCPLHYFLRHLVMMGETRRIGGDRYLRSLN
ncbi:hypothetical protein Hanom_Chr05g00432521 [Helianthus anomalus]